MDRPVPNTLEILYVRQAKSKLSFQNVQNVAFYNWLFTKNKQTIKSHPQFPRFSLGHPCTVPPQFVPPFVNRTVCIFLTQASFKEAPVKTTSIY